MSFHRSRCAFATELPSEPQAFKVAAPGNGLEALVSDLGVADLGLALEDVTLEARAHRDCSLVQWDSSCRIPASVSFIAHLEAGDTDMYRYISHRAYTRIIDICCIMYAYTLSFFPST